MEKRVPDDARDACLAAPYGAPDARLPALIGIPGCSLRFRCDAQLLVCAVLSRADNGSLPCKSESSSRLHFELHPPT